jgi:hypothetical protein
MSLQQLQALLDQAEEHERDAREFFSTDDVWTARRREMAQIKLDLLDTARAVFEKVLRDSQGLPPNFAQLTREKVRDPRFWGGEFRERWIESEKERGLAN